MATIIFVWRQSRQTQHQLLLTKQQMDSSLRPWLGAGEGLKDEGHESDLTFYYKNYGELPTTSLKIRIHASEKLIEEQDIRSRNEDAVGIIFPEQIKRYKMKTNVEDFKRAQKPFFTGILIEYLYADNKNGEYGVVYEYSKEAKGFLIKKEWAK